MVNRRVAGQPLEHNPLKDIRAKETSLGLNAG